VAATTQIAVPVGVASPIALWHLLSLDAPTVAALWVWFVARACQMRLPLAVPAAMYLVVWMVYAADRLLDARAVNDAGHGAAGEDLEARHYFHHRHRRAFAAGVAVAGAAVAALFPRLEPAAVPLYLVEGALLAAWFLVLHATSSGHRLPKEIAVGLFFSAAVFIPTVARAPFAIGSSLRVAMLPCAVLFGALCSLNCLFIYAWEHEGEAFAGSRPAHATTRLAVGSLQALARGIALGGVALAVLYAVTARQLALAQIPIACALAAILLLLLDRNRRRLSRLDLRAAADLALLTPVLFLPILR
jgi:hypothetical protein